MGTVGRRRCGYRGRCPKNPEAVCVVVLMPSRPPGLEPAPRPVSSLLPSPLGAPNDGKRKNKTKHEKQPKGQRTNSNLSGRKRRLRDARGGAQPALGFCSVAPSLNAIMQFIGEKAEASLPKSGWRLERERGDMYIYICTQWCLFCRVVFLWFWKARRRVIRHLSVGHGRRRSRGKEHQAWGQPVNYYCKLLFYYYFIRLLL